MRSLCLTLLLCWPLLLAAAGGVAAYEGEQALHAEAQEEGGLTVYTAQHDDVAAGALCRGFEQRYSGVACRLLVAPSGPLHARIARERAAGLRAVSVLSTTDPALLRRMKRTDQLEHYVPLGLPALRKELRPFHDPHGYYHVTAIGRLVVVRPAQARQDRDWSGLPATAGQGGLALVHPARSGAVGALLEQMRRTQGEGWLQRLAAAEPRWVGTHAEALAAVEAGTVGAAVAPLAQVARRQAGGAALSVGPAAVALPWATAILAGSPHPYAARLYVEFLLSRDAEAIRLALGEAPLRGDSRPAETSGSKAALALFWPQPETWAEPRVQVDALLPASSP